MIFVLSSVWKHHKSMFSSVSVLDSKFMTVPYFETEDFETKTEQHQQSFYLMFHFVRAYVLVQCFFLFQRFEDTEWHFLFDSTNTTVSFWNTVLVVFQKKQKIERLRIPVLNLTAELCEIMELKRLAGLDFVLVSVSFWNSHKK